MFGFLTPNEFIGFAFFMAAIMAILLITGRKKYNKPTKTILAFCIPTGIIAAIQRWAITYSNSILLRKGFTILWGIACITLIGLIIIIGIKALVSKQAQGVKRTQIIVALCLFVIIVIVMSLLFLFAKPAS